MKSGYEKLFQEIARTNEILAERVIELNHNQNDTKGEETAEMMHQDYAKLYDQLSKEDFELEQLTRNDWAKILVGTMIAVQNIEDRIKGEQKAVEGYKIDVIPKLQRIIDETKSDEEVRNLIPEIFKIEETNN